jgi:hypothetical protein
MLKDRYRKYRRDRWARAVVQLGRYEDKLHVLRAQLEPGRDGERLALSAQIDRLNRRRMSLLNKLKETA